MNKFSNNITTLGFMIINGHRLVIGALKIHWKLEINN